MHTVGVHLLDKLSALTFHKLFALILEFLRLSCGIRLYHPHLRELVEVEPLQRLRRHCHGFHSDTQLFLMAFPWTQSTKLSAKVPLQCTPQEMAYFKILYEENQTLEVKSLLEAIAPHVQVSSQGDTILLSGTSEAIQRANTQILQSRIFQDVLCITFPFKCHSDFLAQIAGCILEPVKKEGHLDVLFICDKSSCASSTGSDSATFSILVFSKKADDLTKASSFLQV